MKVQLLLFYQLFSQLTETMNSEENAFSRTDSQEQIDRGIKFYRELMMSRWRCHKKGKSSRHYKTFKKKFSRILFICIYLKRFNCTLYRIQDI